MSPVNNNHSGFPPYYEGPARYDSGTGQWENYEPPPQGYIYGDPTYGRVPRLIPTDTAPAATRPGAGGNSNQAAASSGRAPGNAPRHPEILQYRQEAASSSTGERNSLSRYPLSGTTREAFNKLSNWKKTIIRHLVNFAENHPDDKIRCSLEDIATLPSGEDRTDIWMLPAVSAWFESSGNPYRPRSVGGSQSSGPGVLKKFRDLLGHEDEHWRDRLKVPMSETTRSVLSDERISPRTKEKEYIIRHAADFVENHPDPAKRCTLIDIINFPAGNGIWGNPSLDAWLRSENNPFRPLGDGGDGKGPTAIRSLRRDFGKNDQ